MLACGSPGEFKGTVAGNKLTVSSAMLIELRDGTGSPVDTIVVMSSRSDVCADTKANRALPGTTSVTFNLSHRDTDNTPLPPDVGEYVAGNAMARVATIAFSKLDDACNNSIAASTANAAGTVTVRSIAAHPGGSITGAFDLTFGGTDHVTGNFDTSYCDATFSIDPSCG